MSNNIDALKGINVFSKKLGKTMELAVINGTIACGDRCAFEMMTDWSDNGWSNSTDNWLDSGWNNSSTNWQNDGWTNGSTWVDSGWSNGGDWTNDGWNNSGGGCYITTACVEYAGLADDCYELEVLRHYRDILVNEDEEFRKSVLVYYRKAPVIVQKIMEDNNKNSILDFLYNELVKKTINLLESGNVEAAKKHYLSIFYKLEEKYC